MAGSLLDRIDAAIAGRCPCGAEPRDGSAYCSPDCEPTAASLDGERHPQTAARWHPGLTRPPLDSPAIRDDAYTITIRVDDRDWQVRVTDGDHYVSCDVDPDGSPAALVERIVDVVRHAKLELAGIRHLVHDDDPWANLVPGAVDGLREFVFAHQPTAGDPSMP